MKTDIYILPNRRFTEFKKAKKSIYAYSDEEKDKIVKEILFAKATEEMS